MSGGAIARKEYAEAVKSVASQTQPPLFKQRPPRWVRWAWLTVAADLIFFANSGYITWHHWSERVPETPPKTPGSSEPEDANPTSKWELRPIWQRAGLCTAFLLSGCGIAGALLFSRSRVIRTLTLAPRTAELAKEPKGTQQLLFMQTCEHANDGGFLLPRKICTLREGRTPGEILVSIEGRKGAWNMQLENALINGKPSSLLEARRAFLGEWKHGKVEGLWTTDMELENRWKSGPVKGKLAAK